MAVAVENIISVIVPFYNVKECVPYCLGTLLDQTFDRYEVVCIDDGSFDGTAEILDSYLDNNKVKVFHIENTGLSYARNFGVAVSTGELVTFVDGDDLVSPEYLMSLYTAYSGSKDCFAIGLCQRVSQNQALGNRVHWETNIRVEVIAGQELIDRILYESILPSAVARLAPRSLYLNHPFPVDAYYEEIYTAGEHISCFSSFALVPKPIYGYVQRQNSIVRRRNAKFKQFTDYQKAVEKFLSDVDKFHPSKSGKRYFESLQLSREFRLLDVINDSADKVKQEKRVILGTVRRQLRLLLHDKGIASANKLRFLLLVYTSCLYCRFFKIYDKFVKNIK